MIKNMLMAASKMLKDSKDEKVVCAKVVIDEIIGSLSPDVKLDPDSMFAPIVPLPQVTKKTKPVLSDNELKGKVTVDHGKITTITGVPLDTTMIELDGVKMTCAEAIGKPFQNGRIL